MDVDPPYLHISHCRLDRLAPNKLRRSINKNTDFNNKLENVLFKISI
jgi:hypothetical protein